MVRCLTILFSLIFFLAGCERYNFSYLKKQQAADTPKKVAIALVDVPLPNRTDARLLGTIDTKVSQEPEDFSTAEVAVECVTLLSAQEIISFYEREMEHLGWRQVACSQTVLSLIFEKPAAYCLILSDCLLIDTTIKSSTKKLLFKVIRFEKYDGGYA